MSKRQWLAAALLAAAVGIVACGSDGDGDEETEVRAVITEVFTSNDPEVCQRLTDELIERTSEATGEEAVADCEQQVQEGDPPGEVEIGDLSIDDDTASASFTAAGGDFDNARGDIELVREGDEWKVSDVSIEAG